MVQATQNGEGPTRLYRHLAQRLFDQIAAGRFRVGDRLPAERDLAIEHNVSRPTVREAIISLEAQGLVEVRVGSGAYVLAMPGRAERPHFHVTAFELIEARLLIEGEAAALAARHISLEELDKLDALVRLIADENRRDEGTDEADRDFHFLIATATRNAAIIHTVEDLWTMRASSPDTALLLTKARAAKVQPVVEEHRLIASAIRSGNPDAAREAMRAHLSAVIDHLLFATEEEAVRKVRDEVRSVRRRYLERNAG